MFGSHSFNANVFGLESFINLIVFFNFIILHFVFILDLVLILLIVIFFYLESFIELICPWISSLDILFLYKIWSSFF
jgi:hypothetical protein